MEKSGAIICTAFSPTRLSARPGPGQRNWRRIEDGVAGENHMGKLTNTLKAVELQPDLILTPELAVSGYEFYKALDKEWIKVDSPAIITIASE
jgi:hypothetical protein